MKKLILSLAFVLGLASQAVSAGKELIPANTLEHITWKVKAGENAWRIAARYAGYRGSRQINLFVDEMLALNKGSRCFKNRNLIWTGCEIKIPAHVASQVTTQGVINNEIFKEEVSRAYDKGKQEYKNDFWIAVLGLIALGLISIVLAVFVRKALNQNGILTEQKKLTDIKLDLGRQQLITKEGLENEVKRLMDTLSEQYQHNEVLSATLAEHKKYAPGQPYEFESRDNGRIADGFIILKSGIDEEGKLYVEKIKCREETCGVEDVKPHPVNANSHYWSHHGTTKHNWPD